MNETDIQECRRIRKEIFLTAYHSGVTHIASGFSCLEILYSLYMKGILKIDPQEPNAPERDKLILSKGHAGLTLYAMLAERGFFDKKKLSGFLKPNANIGGEPLIHELAGIETSTGSLGHGLSVGVGMALAQKINGYDSKTFVILGDGEIEEGSVWEAAGSAAAFNLNNLVAILDKNNLQKMDLVENTIGNTDWEIKWRAFGWDVINVENGNDTDQLIAAFNKPYDMEKPRMMICNTVKGKGVSVMENNVKWHFKLPTKAKEIRCFCDELGIEEGELKEIC